MSVSFMVSSDDSVVAIVEEEGPLVKYVAMTATSDNQKTPTVSIYLPSIV